MSDSLDELFDTHMAERAEQVEARAARDTIDCPKCGGSGGGDDPVLSCSQCDGTGQVEPCCICGRPSTTLYDDREDCPSCGSLRCGLKMQAAMDYHEERGQ